MGEPSPRQSYCSSKLSTGGEPLGQSPPSKEEGKSWDLDFEMTLPNRRTRFPSALGEAGVELD